MPDGPGSLIEPRPQERLLTFASGGWVLLASGALAFGLIAWALWGALARGGRLPGDGVHVESYGFDLSTCLVARETIAAAGMRKGALVAMVDPGSVSAEEAGRHQGPPAGTYLVGGDRVIGVVLNGQARAYPLLVLNAHEIVNDSLGGVPIAVTYNPLCDSAAVFEREVAGVTLQFGVSGLVCNSNLLMFDRRPDAAGESLWSQILGRAIAGPAAESSQVLVHVPAELVTWEHWRARHPGTSVVARDPRKVKLYKQLSLPYEQYFKSDEIRFPVHPAPPPPPRGPPAKARVVAVADGSGGWRVFRYDQIAEGEGGGRGGDSTLRFDYDAASNTVAIEDARTGEPVVAIHCLWFAWHAMHPERVSADR